MKITILQGAFFPVPPIRGGAVEKIWYRMGQEFASLGYKVVHISKNHPGISSLSNANGVEYRRVKGYDTPESLIKLKWLDLLYSIRAVRAIPDDSDVIVTNTFWSPLLLRGKSGRKVYMDVERLPRGQMKLYRHVGRLRGCSPMICNAIKQELSTDYHHLVSYVPNPVPFDIEPVPIERENIILFVGRLHPQKGVHILLKAFSLIEKKYGRKWKLLIVGPHKVKAGGGGDEYYKSLLKLSEGLNVEFTGPVYGEKELIKFYAKALIFCYPAQDDSGDAAPVAPREAMAYGCVPVVSELPCFNDLIHPRLNGLTYNQKDDNQPLELYKSIDILIENQEVLDELSKNGKKINETFSSAVIAHQFVEDFKKML